MKSTFPDKYYYSAIITYEENQKIETKFPGFKLVESGLDNATFAINQ